MPHSLPYKLNEQSPDVVKRLPLSHHQRAPRRSQQELWRPAAGTAAPPPGPAKDFPPARRALGLVRARTSIQHTAGDVAQNLPDTYMTENPTWSALTLLW